MRTGFHRGCERGRCLEVLDEDAIAEAVLRGSATRQGHARWMQALLHALRRAYPVREIACCVRAQLVGGVVALRSQAAATMSS